jgi:hypothetical protein
MRTAIFYSKTSVAFDKSPTRIEEKQSGFSALDHGLAKRSNLQRWMRH